MNILLVDDEPLQLRLTQKLLQSIDPGCCVSVAGGAPQALRLLSAQSYDLLITDIKMPDVSGLEMIAQIRAGSKNRAIVVAILSGYGEFAYAQMAIDYGAFSYLLKPISRQDLAELLAKTRAELHARRLATLPDRTGAQRARMEYALYKAVQGLNLSGEEREDLSQLLPRSSAIRVLALRTAVQEDLSQRAQLRMEAQRLHGVFLPLAPGQALLVLDAESVSDDWSQRWDASLGVCAGLSLAHPPGEVRHAYQEALCAAQATFFGGVCLRVYSTERPQEDREALTEGFKEAVATGSGVRERFRELATHFHRAFGSRAEFEQLLLNVVYQLLANYSLYFVNETIRNECHRRYADLVESAATLGEMEEAMARFSETLGKMVGQGSYEKLQENCRLYIEKNLAEGLTLKRMAADFGYNVSYFSELFSRLFGVGFSEYLLGERMREAVRLLKDTDLKIYEVAEKTGYHTPAYFVKTFKEHYGIPPKQYRKQQLSDPQV